MGTTGNMGTRDSPEGVPHWSVKTLLWHKLNRALVAKPRSYASPLPTEFRNVSFPSEFHDSLLDQALTRAMERLGHRPGYSFVAYDEAPHNECEGGYMLVNILGGLQGGRVLLETRFAGFIPDIALYAKDADMPSCIIEVVHTSSPSAVKLDAMKSRGVEVYRLNAYDKNPLTILKEPVLVQGLVTQRCGKSLRKEISALAQAWTDAQWPFVGIRTHPSGAQEYLYGEHDHYGDVEWQHGEPEVRALVKLDAAWPNPPRIRPVKERTISRDLFMSYLMWQKSVIIQLAHQREEGLSDTLKDHVQLTKLEALVSSHIEDLLHMVRLPNV